MIGHGSNSLSRRPTRIEPASVGDTARRTVLGPAHPIDAPAAAPTNDPSLGTIATDAVADKPSLAPKLSLSGSTTGGGSLAASAGQDRQKTEAHLDACKLEHERLRKAYSKGFLSETDARAMPPPLRAKRLALETQLAQIEIEPQVVVLHPASIKNYLANVETLQDGLPTIVHDAPGSLA